MVSSNKESRKPLWLWTVRILIGLTIALSVLGLLVAIRSNNKTAEQLEKVIHDIAAQQQQAQSRQENSVKDAQRQTGEVLDSAEASLDQMRKDLDDLVSQIRTAIVQQQDDRRAFEVEMKGWRDERETYNRLLSNLSTQIEKISDSSDANRSDNQRAGGER